MHYDIKASGLRIKNLRQEKMLTQEQLAERLHISVSMLSKMERGSTGVSIDRLIEIAEIFSVSTDYILLGRELRTDKFKRKIHQMMEELIEIEKQL